MNLAPPFAGTLRAAVFLDRDGVLNESVIRDGKPYPPESLAEFKLCAGAAEACRQLYAANYVLVVVTNQPDVGRGTQSRSVVEAMHDKLRQKIPEIERIEVCYAPGRGISHPDDRRRKPAPGMIYDAASSLGLDLSRSWMVGDRWRDIDCGERADLRTILIDRHYDESLHVRPYVTVLSIEAAATIVLAEPRN